MIVSSATMGPDAARTLAEKARERQLLFLDAPVSGGAVKARAGEMTVMASGSAAAFGKAAPVLDAVAAKVWNLGEEPGIGATVKVVHQLLAGVHIAVAAEAMALGIRAGADPRQLYDVVTSAAGNSWMFENRMARVLDGDDAPRSAVDIFVKDLGLVADMARGLNFPAPLAATAQQLFTAARGHGAGGQGRRLRDPCLAGDDRDQAARGLSAASTAWATWNRRASPVCSPVSIRPTGGSPCSWQGRLIEQRSRKFPTLVFRSSAMLMRLYSRSSSTSAMAGGTTGQVGQIMASKGAVRGAMAAMIFSARGATNST